MLCVELCKRTRRPQQIKARIDPATQMCHRKKETKPDCKSIVEEAAEVALSELLPMNCECSMLYANAPIQVSLATYLCCVMVWEKAKASKGCSLTVGKNTQFLDFYN